MTEKYKQQRDRYVAFCLAAADLLIELDDKGLIICLQGATQTLLAHHKDPLIGKNIDCLFNQNDLPMLSSLLNKAKKIGRIDPVRIALDQGANPALAAQMGICFLDHIKTSFLTLTLLTLEISHDNLSLDEDTQLLDSRGFQDYAQQALSVNETTASKSPSQMQLIKLAGLSEIIQGLDETSGSALLRDIGSLLRAQSLGGASAGRIGDEEFGVLNQSGPLAFAQDILTDDLQRASKRAGLSPDAIKSSVVSVNIATGDLDKDSIAKALAFVVNNFTGPENNTPLSLQEGLSAAMGETLATIDKVKQILREDRFSLFYQPVVSLKDRGVHHFEALMRFEDGRSPYDVIRFSEQLGLVQDFDLLVCKKAIEVLIENPHIKIAVNLSGGSVQSEAYCSALRELIAPHSALRNRLLFELTESHSIEDLEIASNFLQWLRKGGYSVCLDDFGAGAAAYNYLRRFDVDYVKIDGPFLQTAQIDPRQRALLHSICVLCNELGTKVIGEMIETEPLATMSAGLGIGYGQGWLFGKPSPLLPGPIIHKATPPKPEPEVAKFSPLLAARRKGASESWG